MRNLICIRNKLTNCISPKKRADRNVTEVESATFKTQTTHNGRKNNIFYRTGTIASSSLNFMKGNTVGYDGF